MGGFFDSTIMAKSQQVALAAVAGHRWVNCFRGSRDGMQGFSFRAQCANRGLLHLNWSRFTF
jgi:hypothetical protein